MLKALWVTAAQMTSKEKIEAVVDYAAKHKIDILFAQVRSRGYVYYASEIEPRHPSIAAGDFDPLGYATQLAHKKDIEIHAWINAYFVWAGGNIPEIKGHVIRQHPEWIMKDRAGWQYLIPEKDRANKYLLSIYTEVADKYEVDGIHFDYIRYPENINAGKDPDLVTDLVGRVAEYLRQQKLPIRLSAAVYPNLKDALKTKGQDWKRWLARGYLDFAVPMTYSKDSAEVAEQVRNILKEVYAEKIIVGLGAYCQEPAELVEKIDLVRRFKVKGVSLFSYDSMEEREGYLAEVTEGCGRLR